MYIERKKRWEQIFAFGDHQKNNINLSEADLENEIHKFRKSKRISD